MFIYSPLFFLFYTLTLNITKNSFKYVAFEIQNKKSIRLGTIVYHRVYVYRRYVALFLRKMSPSLHLLLNTTNFVITGRTIARLIPKMCRRAFYGTSTVLPRIIA